MADFSEGVGVFSGLGVSFFFAVPFAFAAFFRSGDASFFCDFFLAAFDFGVGLGDFFDFREVVIGSGVSLGFGFGIASSSWPDSLANFDLRGCGDFSGSDSAPVSLVGFPAAALAFEIGLGDSSVVAEAPVLFFGFSVASFAFGIELGDFAGVAKLPRFFFDLFATALAFAIGLGDFSGVGDETVAYWLFSSLLTWARRRLPAIAPSATAVASQRRKQTTATERNRARDAINPEASTVIC